MASSSLHLQHGQHCRWPTVASLRRRLRCTDLHNANGLCDVEGLIKYGAWGYMAALPTTCRPNKRLIFNLNKSRKGRVRPLKLSRPEALPEHLQLHLMEMLDYDAIGWRAWQELLFQGYQGSTQFSLIKSHRCTYVFTEKSTISAFVTSVIGTCELHAIATGSALGK